ncbi:MAG TPA: Crp/Fnr family transcriptional regulator [Chryseosolibacter sp.]
MEGIQAKKVVHCWEACWSDSSMEEWQQKVISIFRSKATISDEAIAALIKKWSHSAQLKRNDFLVSRGQVETNLYYVVSGSMRIFYPVKEEEIVAGFAYDHNLICSYPSFIRQQPSDYAIQALGTTKLKFIKRSDFYDLFNAHRDIETAWRMLEEEALVGKIEREVEMLTFTPEERYKRLMDRSPHIFQIIPRKYIASYLRMSPETLSRIKLV